MYGVGDGVSDTISNPAHVYLLQDTFYAKLTAVSFQCHDSLVESVPLVHPLHAHLPWLRISFARKTLHSLPIINRHRAQLQVAVW